MTTTDNLTARLAEMRRYVEAATPGPWFKHDFGHPGDEEPTSIVIHRGRFRWADVALPDGESALAWMPGWDTPEDTNAYFITHARTDMPALLAALEAVVEMHRREIRDHGESECFGHCSGCDNAWPCPTITAVTSAVTATNVAVDQN